MRVRGRDAWRGEGVGPKNCDQRSGSLVGGRSKHAKTVVGNLAAASSYLWTLPGFSGRPDPHPQPYK